MGNETSFQSFPAHVHNALCQILQEREDTKYVVHTKIYPKYKSRNKIEIARDIFSDWLAPHEDDNTDVILLGHSLGGILSAEVALKPVLGEQKRYRHRILGTINFDTPFLGMHPGVVSSGLASLFKPAAEIPSPRPALQPATISTGPNSVRTNSNIETSSSGASLRTGSSQTLSRPTETLSTTSSYNTTSSGPPLDLPIRDPNYDPPYTNDIRQPNRSGWAKALHFVNKHADGATLVAKSNALSHALKSYVTSHAEFGGCLADFKGLRARYRTLRELEDGRDGERIRFVNYYTACNGRPRRRTPSPRRRKASPEDQVDEQRAAVERDLRDMQLQPPDEEAILSTLDGSVEEYADHDTTVVSHPIDDQHPTAEEAEDKDNNSKSDASSTVRLSPAPTEDSDDEDPPRTTTPIHVPTENASIDEDEQDDHDLLSSPENPPQPSNPALPLSPIPTPLATPPPFDPFPYPDPTALKTAEKEHARLLKQHAHEVKDHSRAIKARQKLISKHERSTQKEAAKATKKATKLDAKSQKLAEKTANDDEDEGDDHVKHEKRRLRKEKSRMEREARRLRGEESGGDDIDTDDDNADPSTTEDPPISVPPTPPRRKPSKSKAKKPTIDKDRVFCILPSSSLSAVSNPHNEKKDAPDPTWVRVFLPGVDEVGAHCGLFFVDGSRYEWFVGDVAGRIVGWVLGEEMGSWRVEDGRGDRVA